MKKGEFLGQDDGNILRVSFVQEMTGESEEAIEKAADEVGACTVVGVILFR